MSLHQAKLHAFFRNKGCMRLVKSREVTKKPCFIIGAKISDLAGRDIFIPKLMILFSENVVHSRYSSLFIKAPYLLISIMTSKHICFT